MSNSKTEANKRISSIKVFLKNLVKTTSVLFILSLCILLGSTLPPHSYWPHAMEIRDLYIEEHNGLSPDKTVKGFDLYRDTFHFSNYGNSTSKNGNCHGIAFTEKAYFENNMEFINRFNLDFTRKPGQQIPTSEEMKNIYNIKNPDQMYLNLLEPFPVSRIWFWFEYYYIANKERIESKDYMKDSNVVQSDPSTKKTFSAFATAQVELNSPKIKDYYKGWIVISDRDSVNKVIDKLNDDTVLVVTVTNKKYGHAILAYGYKKVDNDTYLIYVADNNVPLLDENRQYIKDNGKAMPQKKVIKTNNQIRGNMYVLIELKDNAAFFKYNPVVNKNYGYSGNGYNSYIPDSNLIFYY